MINLNNIDKYFNKNKSNQIHVIDNVSLELPKTGFVAILGKSGSGKTTLLNVMSGLDSSDKGTVSIDGVTLKRYNPRLWDSLRSKRIGYVFQNYYLFNDKSVYENLEIALNLAGLYDKAEIDKRIDYALSLVGLSKYKKRKPSTLSGGQQQRVGIARALVKSPSVIIADEPTGNLDSRNTYEVMEKLKSISKYCLVVLVTHEEKIADFFADRIIRLKDGKIIDDTANSVEQSLDIREKNAIYLKDLSNSSGEYDDNVSINHYYDKSKSKITVDIIESEGRIYIKAYSEDADIVMLDKKSDIKLLDESYKVKSNIDNKITDIDTTILSRLDTVRKGNAIKTSIAFRNAFRRYASQPAKKKFMSHMLLSAAASLLVFIIAFGFNVFIFDQDSYIRDKRILGVYSSYWGPNALTIDDVLNEKGKHGIEYVLPDDTSIYVEPVNPDSYYNYSVSVDMFPLEIMSEGTTLIKGTKAIPSSGEAVIDIKTAEDAAPALLQMGINRIEFLIGEKVQYSDMRYDSDAKTYKIVGIVDSGVSGVYIANEDYDNLLSDLSDSTNFKIISSDKKATTDYLESNNCYVGDPYELELEMFNEVKNIMGYAIGIAMVAVVLVVISITGRNVRAGFIERVRDIGAYRSIGAKKQDVSKEFIFESLIMTTFSSLLGFAISSYIVRKLISVLSNYPLSFIGFYYPVWIMIILFVFIYGVNVLMSLIRANKLMLSTPAQIMAKYDI